MRRRTASGVSLTEAASAADAGGSLALPPGDIRRTNSRNAPATRDLRHAVVNGTRGSVGGRRALRRATIRLRRAKGPPHGLVILPGGRTVRRSGARSREPRAGVPRGLSMPYTRRRMDASPGGTSARHPQGPASPHAKEARTHQRRCLEAQVARRRDEERRAARGEALASAARHPRHRHDARLPFMMNALPGADGGWSGDARHSASRIGSAGRRTPPAPAPAPARRTPRPVRPHPPECRECALHAPHVTRSVPSSAHPSDRPRRRREDGAAATPRTAPISHRILASRCCRASRAVPRARALHPELPA